jgi:alpha-tubulin suppressor-like RCC1 family protein
MRVKQRPLATRKRHVPALTAGTIAFACSFFAAPAHAERLPSTLSAGFSHTCATKGSGALYCWGANDSGQLGDGTTVGRSIPAPVAMLGSGVAEVSASDLFTCARKTDGTVWCWGNNASGQLGDGTTDDNLIPEQVVALGANVAQISTGDLFACARKTDGTVWCWGSGGFLGDGVDSSLVPVQVASLGNTVVEISCGDGTSCARKADGTLFCWGSNAFGAVGDGTTIDRPTPVQVTALANNVAEVSVGDVFACAREVDNSLWCWGTGGRGELGDHGTTDHFVPMLVRPITGGTAFGIQLSANGQHACDIDANRALLCWGSASSGEIGNNQIANAIVAPVTVTSLGMTAAEVTTGVNHDTCVRKVDGSIFCWGLNASGELGDGTTSDRHTPVQVIGFGPPSAVPAGTPWTFALLALSIAGLAFSKLRQSHA